MTRRWPRIVAAAASMLVGLGVGAPAAHASGASILGGGSGFAALEIDQWRGDTARSPFNLTVNYVSRGSTFGRQQFSGGSFDYGASDIQYQQLELPDLQSHRCRGRSFAQCFVYVPVSAGGLSLMYNVVDSSGNRINDLKLTRQAACKIFTGAITKWNDPEIVATNPRFASFNRDIRPVIRTDGAGESYVFSEFCIAVAPTVWQTFVNHEKSSGNTDLTPEFIAGQPTSVWPQANWGNNPITVQNADGTAGYVADPVGGPNSITYVAAGYAINDGFPMASLQNAAGVFTQPAEQNVTVALGYATPRGNGTFKLAFSGPDPRAYFPSTYSYVLAQTSGFDAAKGASLGQFLCYAVSEGQVDAPTLGYARLSSALVNIAIDAIVQIPGAPRGAECPVAGAPPPPPPPIVESPGGGAVTTTVPANGGTANGGTAASSGVLSRGLNGKSGPGGAGTCATTTTTRQTTSATTKGAATSAPHRVTTKTTTTTAPCSTAVVDPLLISRGAAAGLAAASVESLDAELAREAQATPANHSSGGTSVWVLLGGACAMFAATTAWGRRRSTA